VVGEVDQARSLFGGAQPLLDALPPRSTDTPAPGHQDGWACQVAATWKRGAPRPRPSSSLSPGERTRAALSPAAEPRREPCLSSMSPTTTLDLPAIEQLESAWRAIRAPLLLVHATTGECWKPSPHRGRRRQVRRLPTAPGSKTPRAEIAERTRGFLSRSVVQWAGLGRRDARTPGGGSVGIPGGGGSFSGFHSCRHRYVPAVLTRLRRLLPAPP